MRSVVAELVVERPQVRLDGFFLGDHRIMLKTYEHGFVLCDAALRPQARVALPHPALGDDAELVTVAALDQDLFAGELWTADETSTTTVWRLPR
ncbi:hypothetical protein AB0K00_56385 [Dactylosporangium sp. NPDC049525]|uniref:hypothetical protein n=1 Tax=Dactylosporangium sp. NPDC049525 TaxID=3154730 RepID=UPI00343CE40D